MPRLLFFSRVALLCNACFLVTFLMHYIPFISNGVVSSTIIVLGTVVAIVINVLVNFIYLMILLSKKPVTTFIPVWMIIINFLFLILQVILLVK